MYAGRSVGAVSNCRWGCDAKRYMWGNGWVYERLAGLDWSGCRTFRKSVPFQRCHYLLPLLLSFSVIIASSNHSASANHRFRLISHNPLQILPGPSHPLLSLQSQRQSPVPSSPIFFPLPSLLFLSLHNPTHLRHKHSRLHPNRPNLPSTTFKSLISRYPASWIPYSM